MHLWKLLAQRDKSSGNIYKKHKYKNNISEDKITEIEKAFIKLEKKIEQFRKREALEIKNLEKFVLSQQLFVMVSAMPVLVWYSWILLLIGMEECLLSIPTMIN